MKLQTKLILCFMSIALLVAAVGYISIKVSKKALQESIEADSAQLANKVLNTIDRNIYSRIEHLQAYSKDLANEQVLINAKYFLSKVS